MSQTRPVTSHFILSIAMTGRSWWRQLFASAAIALAIAGCGSSDKTQCGGFVEPTRILTPSATALALDVGAAGQVSAALSGGCASDDPTVSWVSSNPAIATVSASGAIAAVSAGTATITGTAFDNRTRTTIVVTVRSRTPTTIDARPDVDTLSPLGTRTLTVTVKDQGGLALPAAPIVWRSLTPQFATVTSAGVVSAVASGTASIEATTPRTLPTDSLRDTVRILIVPACNLVRPIQLGTTFTGSFDASTCQNLYGFRIANQYSVTALTQAYYSIKLTPNVSTSLVPLNIGSALYGLPAADTAVTAYVVIKPGTTGFLIAAPFPATGVYSVTTALDPDPKLLCIPTDVTFNVRFNTGVTPSCTTRDIRLLPTLTAGQQVRATATAPTYAVTMELRNGANNNLLQRVVASAAGANATINYTNPSGTPLVYLRVFGGTTVTDLVTVTIQP
jgi:Bacterial Ig-like domain (group 2)